MSPGNQADWGAGVAAAVRIFGKVRGQGSKAPAAARASLRHCCRPIISLGLKYWTNRAAICHTVTTNFPWAGESRIQDPDGGCGNESVAIIVLVAGVCFAVAISDILCCIIHQRMSYRNTKTGGLCVPAEVYLQAYPRVLYLSTGRIKSFG